MSATSQISSLRRFDFDLIFRGRVIAQRMHDHEKQRNRAESSGHELDSRSLTDQERIGGMVVLHGSELR